MGIKQAVERIKSFFVSISNTAVETMGKLFKNKGKRVIGNTSSKATTTSSSNSSLLRRFKIKTRLIASLTLLLVIVLLVTGISSYRNSTSTIDEKVRAYSLELMKQTSVVLNNQLARSEAQFTEIGLSNSVQDAVAVSHTDTYEQMQAERNLSDFIVKQFMMNDDVSDCTLYFGENFSRNVSYSNQSMALDPEKALKDCKDSITWTYFDVQMGSKTEKHLGMMKNLKGLLSGNTIAKMVLIPKTTFLDSSYEKMDIGIDESGKSFPIIVLDNKGTIISSRSNDKYPIGQSNEASKKIAADISKLTEKTTKAVAQNLVMDINGESSLVTFSTLKVTDQKWSIVSIVPYSYLNHAANSLKNSIIGIGVFCLLIAILLCLVIARSVSVPLDKLVFAMKKAKEGDLTSQIRDKGNDEIADVCLNYNEMLMNICKLASQVRKTSQSVVQAAGQIATASEASYTSSGQVATTVEQIASGATDQATEINESVATMDVLSEGITHVNDDVAQVIAITNKIGELHSEAYKTLADLNQKSDQVSNTSSKVSTNINELSKSMKEIQKILKIMIGISEQTNLLSLNAAIEAARAGEAGKGFAVVANEVKKLAEQSKEFTSNINNIIASIEKKTNDTVEEVTNSDKVVSEQIEAVKNTEMLFKTVFSSVEEVIKNIERTEKSVEGIMKSKEKVLESMENISAVAEESAATTEEISASTEEQIASAEELSNYAKSLNDLAVALNSEIDKFKTE